MYRLAFLFSILVLTSACNTLSYYSQAIGGHLSLMARSESVEKVLSDPETSIELRQRLLLVTDILEFAALEMRLPNHGSYQRYVKVAGRYVVWNVVATPPYSVEARRWCYPIAGCVTYRGYYAEEDARQYAKILENQGLDIAVAGASAYSTLGWLDDPLFSSMMYKDEARLVEVIIHELAHQRLYIAGDTVFNESFASVVAREGVRRWFEQKQLTVEYEKFIQGQGMDRALNRLLMDGREQLQAVYASTASDEVKASEKLRIFADMQHHYLRLKSSGKVDGRFDNWMKGPLNNAHLALVAAYHQLEPELEALINHESGNMESFYQAAERFVDKKKRIEESRFAEN